MSIESKKWILASNRLPFRFDSGSGELVQSSGGLVTAISGINNADAEIVWVGVAPDDASVEQLEKLKNLKSANKSYHPISVNEETYDSYYNGLCNNALWPLLHYESRRVDFSEQSWDAYREVNSLFAQAIIEHADENSLVWVHDFHLFMLPRELKRRAPRLRVGFFLHTPFPSSEILRQFPVREQLLDSILSSDLVGFHDYSYLRHFVSSVYAVLGLESSMLHVEQLNHSTRLGVFPVSIDTQHFRQQSNSMEVRQEVKSLKREQTAEFLLLGVDRLDYIKGIDLKLKAFRDLLERFPELRGRVSLLQIAVPSRVEVPEYSELKAEIERLVGEINGAYGRPNFVPVQYLFSSVPFHELLALYRQANALLVTSKRDGMNLVALEYLACQNERDPGVVVLSEFAGASSTLSHAIIVNPWDIASTAHKIFEALTMEREERQQSHKQMVKFLESYTANDWAESFLRSLDQGSARDERQDSAKLIKPESLSGLETVGENAPLVLFLDYDGTLVPICRTPEEAQITPETKELLSSLSNISGLTLAIVSGRDRKFLVSQLSGMNIWIGSEHGARVYDPSTERWKTLVRDRDPEWRKVAQRLFEDYSVRVPGSFVERKRFGLAWHYRKSPADFAEYQARRLKVDLGQALHESHVSIIWGKKVVEVRPLEADKGRFVSWLLESQELLNHADVLAIGDDQTDEDMFSALQRLSLRSRARYYTIRVGSASTAASFRVNTQQEVIPLLKKLCLTKGLGNG